MTEYFIPDFIKFFIYLIYIILDNYILKCFLSKSITRLMIRPLFIFIMPLISLIFASIPYALFLLGFNIQMIFGIKPTDKTINLSSFQIKYGNLCNFISLILLVVSIIWGTKNLIWG